MNLTFWVKAKGQNECAPPTSKDLIHRKKQHQVNPKRVEEMPVNGEQAEAEALFGVGKIDEHRDGVHHVLFGSAIKLE